MLTCKLCGSENVSSSCHCRVCGETLAFLACSHNEDSRWGQSQMVDQAVVVKAARRRPFSVDQVSLF